MNTVNGKTGFHIEPTQVGGWSTWALVDHGLKDKRSLPRVIAFLDRTEDRERLRSQLAAIREIEVEREIEQAEELERLARAEEAGEVAGPRLHPSRLAGIEP